jgi:hypothetical protein
MQKKRSNSIGGSTMRTHLHRVGSAWLALLAGALFVCPVLAEEILVRNDRVESGGSLVVVGDFVAGEQAAVWLESPCDGEIVAIRIIWWSFFPGAQQTVEEAIHISDGSTFPFPGLEWELLEAPLLTPNMENEFRYLDENQTIPISVPVSKNQRFVVALEFFNPTDIQNGTASVVRDLDGCTANGNGLFAIPGGWLNFCIFLQGDLAIRAVIDCPDPTGACCYTDGICQEGVEEGDCLQEFGASWQEGATCADITCVARGACCRQGGCLDLLSEADCLAIGGMYAGNGSDCNANVCVLGACCMADGSCSEVFEFECLDMGGTYEGHGTVCVPNPCPQPAGACCFGMTCLSNQLQAACIGAGGTWIGPNSVCSPNPCVTPTGACCDFANYACSVQTADDCDTAGGVYQGDGVLCSPSPCVCFGDMDCEGDIDFDDITLFVTSIGDDGTAWAAAYEALHGSPPACSFENSDSDGDDDCDFDDITPFVDAIGNYCAGVPQ